MEHIATATAAGLMGPKHVEDLAAHLANTGNPHGVTPSQIGAKAHYSRGDIPLATGTADSIVVTLPHGLTAYTDRDIYQFEASNNNTAAGAPSPTEINFNTLGAKVAKKMTSVGLVDLHAAAIRIGNVYAALYDASADVLVVLNPTPKAPNKIVHEIGTTYVPSVGATHGLVEVQGAGGGGGGAASTGASTRSSGGGGGAGGYARALIDLSVIDSATITVGVAGNGANGNNAGGNGSPSSYADGTNTITGNAGNGGNSMASTSGNSRTGGGNGGAASGGDIVIGGQSGGDTLVSNNGGVVMGGLGGDSALGLGGAIQTTSNGNSPGLNGSGYGSGGSGAANGTSESATTGGNGADGVVIIWEFF